MTTKSVESAVTGGHFIFKPWHVDAISRFMNELTGLKNMFKGYLEGADVINTKSVASEVTGGHITLHTWHINAIFAL